VLVAGGDLGLQFITSAEVYDPAEDTWTTVASMNTGRIVHTATLLPNGKVLVAGGESTGKILTNSAELYDPIAGTWTDAASMNTGRILHTATLLPNGNVLVVGGCLANDCSSVASSTEIHDPNSGASGAWTAGASLNGARGSQDATLLPDGRVLVSGGYNAGTLASAEVLDPSEGGWQAVQPLNDARWFESATLLQSGHVLVAGGSGSAALTSAERYDPDDDTWTPVANMSIARNRQAATLLLNGEVVVAAGYNEAAGYLSSAELYDPLANRWTSATSLNVPRYVHTATLLPDGKVLVVRGLDAVNSLSGVERYDPMANTWTNVESLDIGRYGHTATLLPNGKVLVVGGYDNHGGGYITQVELYDPLTSTWTIVAPIHYGRYFYTSTLLPNGKVLIAAGENSGGAINSAELYDPNSGALGAWTDVPPLNVARRYHTATLLLNGQVLVSGGSNNGGAGNLNNVEVYDRDLGFEEVWRPTVSVLSPWLITGNPLTFTGAGLRGYGLAEASGGGTYSSASSVPLVQIRRLDNEQWLWVTPGAFTATSYTSLPVTDMAKGPALVTVFVNGIPSISKGIVLKDYVYAFLPVVLR
jgi:hypothetical protein